jgi:hypothetical protein
MAMNLEFGICRKNPIGRSGSQNVAQKKLHVMWWFGATSCCGTQAGWEWWWEKESGSGLIIIRKLSREKASERAMQINSLAYLHSQGCGIDHPSTEMFLANLGFPHWDVLWQFTIKKTPEVSFSSASSHRQQQFEIKQNYYTWWRVENHLLSTRGSFWFLRGDSSSGSSLRSPNSCPLWSLVGVVAWMVLAPSCSTICVRQ